MVPGEKLSITTSAQPTRRLATSTPSSARRSTARLRLEVLYIAAHCERLSPCTSSLKGGRLRARSGRFEDSTRTTVAP